MTLTVSLNHIIGDAGYVKYLFRNVERYLNGEICIDECVPNALPETPCNFFTQAHTFLRAPLHADFTLRNHSYQMQNLTKSVHLSKKPRLIN